jgi:hypothetical protein
MEGNHTKGEMHGCIVCGKLHQLYVVYDAEGRFLDCTVMSGDGKCIPNPERALVACDRHTQAEVERAISRVYGKPGQLDD